jgi:hypothetical protein
MIKGPQQSEGMISGHGEEHPRLGERKVQEAEMGILGVWEEHPEGLCRFSGGVGMKNGKKGLESGSQDRSHRALHDYRACQRL